MLENIRTITKRKGQGIVEYALLLAFVVGIAMTLNNTSIGSAVKSVFEDVVIAIEGNKYAPYFQKWHDKTSAWLNENVLNEERLQADQEGLARIARAFIGLDEDRVKDLIKTLSVKRNGEVSFDNATNYMAKEGNDGWSDTLVPLSYNTNNLDDPSDPTKHYIHLDWSGNVDTVKLLTNDVEAYKGANSAAGQTSNYDEWKNSGVSDRIFYSDGMINANGNRANDKMVTLQVHYENGVVDKVNIQARDVWASDSTKDGNKNANKDKYSTVEGLNLQVTKTEINQINN